MQTIPNEKASNRKVLMFSLRKISGWVFAVQVVVLWTYLCGNIAFGRENGVLVQVLLIFLLLGGIQILAKLPNLRIRFHLWLVLFFLFVAYFKFSIDVSDGGVSAREYLVGTTGGMGLFYIVGFLLGHKLWSLRNEPISNFVMLLLFYCCAVLFLFYQITFDLRSDVLLVGDGDNYQRHGDFAILMHITMSALYVRHCLSRGGLSSGAIIITSASYAMSGLLMAISAQLVGSNKALLVIPVITLLATSCVLALGSESFRQILGQGRSSLVALTVSLAASSFRIVVLATLLLWPFAQWWKDSSGWAITDLRIFGFGEYESSSIGSRIQIMREHLFEQLSYAPILGHANVSYLTAGDAGAHIHSSFFSVWTMLGLPGVFVFTTLLYICIRILFHRSVRCSVGVNSANLSHKAVNLFYLMSLVFILIVSLVGTHFSWAPLWFAIGIFAPPVYSATERQNPI